MGARHADELGEHGATFFRVDQVVEQPAADDHVERVFGERQLGGARTDERAAAPVDLPQHELGHVDAGPGGRLARVRERPDRGLAQPAGPARHVEEGR
ncbi:MAG: hypothetical protein AAF957_04410 [Planctomycetota bacterium]